MSSRRASGSGTVSINVRFNGVNLVEIMEADRVGGEMGDSSDFLKNFPKMRSRKIVSFLFFVEARWPYEETA